MNPNSIRLGLTSVNQTPLDWKGNLARMHRALEKARKLEIRVLCFPELTLTAYGCEDRFLHPDTSHRALKLTAEFAKEVGSEVVIVGIPLIFKGRIYNGAAVLNRGQIRGIALKTFLARDGIHYEPRWFSPWPKGFKDFIEINDKPIPIGSLIFTVSGFRFGIEICEDAWVPAEDRPCGLFKGIHWVFNLSASHYSFGKSDVRERLVADASARFGVGYGYANLIGCEAGRAIYEGELLFAVNGQIVHRAPRFYLDDTWVEAIDFPFERFSAHADVHLEVDANAPATELPPYRIQRDEPPKEVEFARATTLALFDYMRKSRARGFILSLSGGVDSSTLAVLVHMLAIRMLRELRPDQLSRKLAYWPELPWQQADPKLLTQHLLSTVYQSTRNSGLTTRTAAKTLAETIGARHLEFDVDLLVESYKSIVGHALGRELSWSHDDAALQNIQARVRGPGIWLLANLSGSLLLTTSNRSEVAVGYATMDGDTCGGLAPLAGVEKTYLRHWLELMEREGLPGFPPIPCLDQVNHQNPTAELRPPEAHQEDEKDLMPYELLDALERAIVRDRLTPLAAAKRVSADFADRFSHKQIAAWTRRFCYLFSTSQWKRERFAPSFHLDDSSLDPKTWARFPILNSPFELELEELDEWEQR